MRGFVVRDSDLHIQKKTQITHSNKFKVVD